MKWAINSKKEESLQKIFFIKVGVINLEQEEGGIFLGGSKNAFNVLLDFRY